MTDTDSTNKIARMIDVYDRGIYTLLEAGSQILEWITAQNVADVYSTLPEQFQQYLKSVIESAPRSDTEWDTAEYFHIRSACYAPGYEPPVKPPHEERAEMLEWKMNHRRRVEALRELINHGKQ